MKARKVEVVESRKKGNIKAIATGVIGLGVGLLTAFGINKFKDRNTDDEDLDDEELDEVGEEYDDQDDESEEETE